MSTKSAGFLVGTLLAATIALPISSTPAWAGTTQGHAVVGAGDDVMRILSFSASSVDPAEGTATGQINFRDPAPNVDQDVDGTGDPSLADAPDGVSLEANVDCLWVEGNRAVVGGQITSASVPRYVGMLVQLYVEDGGPGGHSDRFSWGVYPAETETGCGSYPVAAYVDDAVSLESGDLQVQQ